MDYILKRSSWSVSTLLVTGVGVALMLSLALAVPKVGAVTIEELMAQIAQLQAQLQALQSGAAQAPAGACTFTRNLFQGTRGNDVTCLQNYLISGGHATFSRATGFYGSLTKAAVAKWQSANGVSPAVGYFGPISRAKYSALAAGGVPTAPTVPGAPGAPGAPVTPVAPAGTGLTIGLAPTTPASRAIVVGAAQISMTRWAFTAGSGSDVVITTLKAHRSGISADGEAGNIYLYDGDTGDYVSQYSGLGSGVVTFSSSAGLFTVKAGMTRNIELRMDVSSSASNNHTMAWGLTDGTGDIVAQTPAGVAVTETGNFPMTGNAMSFVSVSSPSIATLTTAVVTTGSTVNAGTTGYLAGSFTAQASNSAVLVDRIILSQTGTAASTDITNVKLVTSGGTQIGSIVSGLTADGKAVFALATPYEIPSGVTVQVNVYSDVIGGVNRTLQWKVLNLRDIIGRDKTYNVGVNPSATVSMTSTTIQTGTLTITLDPSSPTGNLAKGQSNVTLAKFKVSAYGEQVKVLWIPFSIKAATSSAIATLPLVNSAVQNVYLVDDAGNQIGSTITSPTGNFAYTAGSNMIWDSNANGTAAATTAGAGTAAQAAAFGSSTSNINYLLPANTTRVWSLKADVQTTLSASVSSLIGALVAGSSNYQGQVSVSNGSTTGVTANSLSIASNPFQGKINQAMGATNLVISQSGARIASFLMSASSAEGINISTLTVTSSSTFSFANLKAFVNGVQFGDTKGSLSTATNYTFSGAAPVVIPAGGNVTVDVYADILSGASNLGSSFYIRLTGASAVGALTSTSQTLVDTSGNTISDTANQVNGQGITINTSGGTLTVAIDGATPSARQLVMGSTGNILGTWRFSGGTSEDINVTDLSIRDKLGTSSDTASISNLAWYKGGVQVGATLVAPTASGTIGYTGTWNFATPVVVPQNGSIALELRGNVPSKASGGATSGRTHTWGFERDADITAKGSGSSLTATISGLADGNTPVRGNAMTIVRAKLTVAVAPNSPSGQHAVNSADTMAYFDLSAEGDTVTVNTLTLKLSGSTLASIQVRLIDDTTNSDWGSSLGTGYNTAGSGSLAGSTIGSSSVSFFPNQTISAGTTKRVRIQANTLNYNAGNGPIGFTTSSSNVTGTRAQWQVANDAGGATTAAFSIYGAGAAANAVCWGDADTTCATSGFNLETRVLPISAPLLQY